MRRHGFTLLELSITLVIIGLLSGAVLMGRDLITAAQARREIGILNGYTIAINTFREKYGALPGDFDGVQTLPDVADDHYGDGNGFIDEIDESGFAWEHLSKAGLIPGRYDGGSVVQACASGKTCPPSALNARGVHWLQSLLSGNWANLVMRGGQRRFSGRTIVLLNRDDSIFMGAATVGQAFAIDSKVDDGIANSGALQAINDVTVATEPGPHHCVVVLTAIAFDPTSSFEYGDYDHADTQMDCILGYVVP